MLTDDFLWCNLLSCRIGALYRGRFVSNYILLRCRICALYRGRFVIYSTEVSNWCFIQRTVCSILLRCQIGALYRGLFAAYY